MLTWGVEHDDRDPTQDIFSLEYVSSIPHAGQEERDREAGEVFELIRPASERWGFKKASISAFPSIQRKGGYDLYLFERATEGAWSFKRIPAKVYIND